jgi:YfiH family protein
MNKIKLIKSNLLSNSLETSFNILNNDKKLSIHTHGFFCKNGGISKDNYASLNFGGNDKKEYIAENYQIIAKYLNIKREKIINVKQYHSNKVVLLEENNVNKIVTNSYQADGIITNITNLAISILTADCVPVLIHATDINYIAAIHAGWQGAVNNIVINAIELLISKGSKANNIKCAIMPSICSNSYEVQEDLYQNIMQKNQLNKKFFIFNNDKIYFDLRKLIINQLNDKDITKIDNIEIDTYQNNQDCFSYRRATQQKLSSTGRHLSFIMLKS